MTRPAQRVFVVPIAFVILVNHDRQWFTSRVGLSASETPYGLFFCGHAIRGNDVFVIRDAIAAARFADNSLAMGQLSIRFYADCSLIVLGGNKLGTLRIIDQQPRRIGDDADVRKYLTTLDQLTGISDRCGFMLRATRSIQLCVRHKMSGPLICFFTPMGLTK